VKVAIIGCGYVGMAVAKYWKSQGFDVLATTTREKRVEELSAIASSVAVVTGTERDRLESVLRDRQIVLLSVASKRGASYADTYLRTAQTLAQVLPHTAVEQLIYTSSSSVYGQHQGAWVSELMPPKPMTDNGKIIEKTEEILLGASAPQRKTCILRLGGIYGPGRTLEQIYTRAAGTTRPGKGNEGTNWVHLSDIIGGIEWARERHLSGLYNLVQDEVPTVRSLISEVCDRYDIPAVHWDESQTSDRKNVRVSNDKIKKTGFRFVHPTFYANKKLA